MDNQGMEVKDYTLHHNERALFVGNRHGFGLETTTNVDREILLIKSMMSGINRPLDLVADTFAARSLGSPITSDC